MKINRTWSMPNPNTFSIKPIKKLIQRILKEKENGVFIDPFVRNSPFKNVCYSNDLDTEIEADKNMDALDFLKSIEENSADVVLFDPPYSPRQISECYKRLGKSVNMETTQGSFWKKMKLELSRITKTNGIVIYFGWNSGGVGKKYGFDIEEILLVPHGGAHNDTIITVCRKTGSM